jgi:hypothetical protein
MGLLRTEIPPSVLAFVPKKEQPNTMVVDDTGENIIPALQRAADMAKSECDRATAPPHKLSFEIRAAEERASQFETDARAAEERARVFEIEANHFRDRAARAEEWLSRVQGEIEKAFFRNK